MRNGHILKRFLFILIYLFISIYPLSSHPHISSIVNATNSLRLKVNGQDTLDAQRLHNRLQVAVGLASVVVVLHVLHAGKLGLGHKVVSLRSGILVGGTDHHGQDVGLAVLEENQLVTVYEQVTCELTFCWLALSLLYCSRRTARSASLGILNMVIRWTRFAILVV